MRKTKQKRKLTEILRQTNEEPKKRKTDFSPKAMSSKMSNAELFKPPTVEELNHLRETEILFNSNLFRLQTEELLQEIAIKEKRQQLITSWVEKFTESLQNIPENLELKLSEVGMVFEKNIKSKLKYIKKIAKYNPTTLKTDVDSSFKFLKPKSIKIVGLYNVLAVSKPILYLTINIVIPSNSFREKDYLNGRYLVKRALYLSYIVTLLKKSDLALEISYNYLHDNPYIPILQIKPYHISRTVINIRVTPEANTFKTSRFYPENSNLQTTYFKTLFDNDSADIEEKLSTPFYNSVIINDLTLEENDKFNVKTLKHLKGACDGLILLNVWLEQRKLCNGFGGFNGDLMFSCVAYLAHTGKINKHMSSYQVIRNVWTHLAKSTWQSNGISLCQTPFNTEQFHRFYDVVFIDCSGHYNLAADLDINIYLKVKREAEFALSYLDEGKLNSFQSLFISRMPFYMQYDAIIQIPKDTRVEEIFNVADKDKKLDYFHFKYPVVLKTMINLLKEGLSDRIISITPIIIPSQSWMAGQEIPSNEINISIGVNLDYFNLFKVVEKGPSTYDPLASRFREFWGDKAELRRFKDGSIVEAVYWHSESLQDKRKIFQNIIHYVLEMKLKLKDFNILSDQFDAVLRIFPHSGIEEANMKVIKVFDELGKKLRELKLPLDITAIQGVSEAFSYSDAFPPIQYKGFDTNTFWSKLKQINYESDMFPEYLAPIEGVMQLAQHSKWPNDYQALCNLKTAFYLKITEELRKTYELKSYTKHDCMIISYNGLLFRFILFHPKQLTALKKTIDEEGVTSFEDTEESTLEEVNYVLLPRIIGALNGIHSQYPSFGPSSALIKRWLNCQLMDDSHFPGIVSNLLNAFLYLNSAPFTQPALPQVAFFRFLHMLANFDWALQSVVVNFNNEINKEELDEHDAHFQKNRPVFPPLYIITPYDNFKSLLTRYAPTTSILNRLRVLGMESISVIQRNIDSQNLFDAEVLLNPNLDGYNVLIHLHPFINPRRNQNIRLLKTQTNSTINYDPIEVQSIQSVGFNPVDLYLKELRKNYSEFALFFHDSYGGDVIAVLWQPNIFQVEEFKISHIVGRKLTIDSKLIVNIDAIIEDFYILGTDLVKNIEKK